MGERLLAFTVTVLAGQGRHVDGDAGVGRVAADMAEMCIGEQEGDQPEVLEILRHLVDHAGTFLAETVEQGILGVVV